MGIVPTVIVLGVLIFVHELGHFWAAKAVGVEVQRFSIGLGPKVFGFQRGETEYVLSAVPLGGYVKMGGMDDEVMDQIEGGPVDAPPREPSDRDFDQKPLWARTLVISAGVIMNMLFAWGVYTFLAAQYGIPELATTRLGYVSESTLPAGTEALADAPIGAEITRIGDQPVEHWGDVRMSLYEAAPGPLSVHFADGEPPVDIRIPESDADRWLLAGSVVGWVDAVIGAANPGDPADEAGLVAGDQILSVDGTTTPNWYALVQEIEARPGQQSQVTIMREGRELVRSITFESEREERGDSVATVGRAGIFQPRTPTEFRPARAGEVVASGWRTTVIRTSQIVGFVRDLFTGGVSPRSLGSIVTIGQASRDAAERGLHDFLDFMAFFSVNLAVLNLLPIPVLDGGHLVFLGIEAVRGGRPLSLETRLKWTNVGFLVIVGIMILALSNDFLRLFGL